MQHLITIITVRLKKGQQKLRDHPISSSGLYFLSQKHSVHVLGLTFH